ncbi:uncharacterized protein LOC132730936 [Ruditapes philippinarum]|uniref:uncharacterized protein LOC132730936 n=1 Tax=Ruditapes philippinarum TaxID=129788 RepID=UPI00295ACACB|nr:uncharacterized protein LOC132730936 [Ruditapes philippinarum]
MMPSKFTIGHVCISVLTVSSVFILGLNIVLYIVKTEEDQLINSGYFIKEIQNFAYFCDDLSLSPDEDDVTFKVRKKLFDVYLLKNRYVCSFRNLTEPLQKFVEKKSRIRLASGQEGKRYLQCGNTSLREPSGRRTAAFRSLSKHQTYKVGESNAVINWDKHPERSFISEDVEYHKGEIKVSEGGFYFIYTTVMMNLTKPMVNLGEMCRFALYVCANRKGYERILLSSFKSFNTSCTNDITNNKMNDATSLSTRGNVYVTKGESVYVKVSGANRIILESVGNTFGIMPLS